MITSTVLCVLARSISLVFALISRHLLFIQVVMNERVMPDPTDRVPEADIK